MDHSPATTEDESLSDALGALEDDMEDVLAEGLEGSGPDSETGPSHADNPNMEAGLPAHLRVTSHTRARLNSYETLRQTQFDIGGDLGQIAALLAKVVTAHHTGRAFVDDVHSDLHRANALEIASTTLASDNRRLQERLEKLEALRTRYEQLVGVMKSREAKLLEDGDELRDNISQLKMAVVEAGNAVMRGDAVQGDLQASVSARIAEAESHSRDAQQLREKVIGLTADLEAAQRRQGEARRKVEEFAAVHASDSARLAEVGQRLAAEEEEVARLEIAKDALEAQLAEANDRAIQALAEIGARDKRHQSEVLSIKSEMKALTTRLEVASSERRDAESEVIALRAQLSDVDGQRMVLENRCTGLSNDLEAERTKAFEAVRSGQLDGADPEEAGRMRREIATLRETIDRLRRRELVAEEKTAPTSVTKTEPAPRFPAPKPQNGAANAPRVAAMRPAVVSSRQPEGDKRDTKAQA